VLVSVVPWRFGVWRIRASSLNTWHSRLSVLDCALCAALLWLFLSQNKKTNTLHAKFHTQMFPLNESQNPTCYCPHSPETEPENIRPLAPPEWLYHISVAPSLSRLSSNKVTQKNHDIHSKKGYHIINHYNKPTLIQASSSSSTPTNNAGGGPSSSLSFSDL
jgi:hypothetical protein